MSSGQNIDIVIKAIDEATATIKRVENQVNNLATTAENSSGRTNKAVGGISTSFGGLGKAIGIAGAAYAAFQSVNGLLKLTSGVENAKIAFDTLLGSQEKTKQMMADIDEFAAKTPFEKVNLTPLVQQLMGMGFEAEKTLPIVQVLGDSMSALGRSQADLDGVVLALGQIQTKGKLSAEELMQMAERGLPVFQILEEKLHLTKKQLENVGAAGITSAQGVSALLTGLNERFGGSMAKMAQTLTGQWSNLMDNLKSLVGTAGQVVNDRVKDFI
jgi:tape measure domain-containing protein